MLKIKDIKHGQIFYGIDDNGEPYGFKAWGNTSVIRIEEEFGQFVIYSAYENLLKAIDSLEERGL